MKKRTYFALGFLLLLAVILFFPVRHTDHISGDGAVLTTNKEKIGDCRVSVEIREVRSLVVTYRRAFSFTIDDGEVFEVNPAHYYEAPGGLCVFSEMYYEESRDRFEVCQLVFQKDLSYVVIYWEGQLYFLPNGTEMSYSEIPMQIGAEGQ